MNSVPTRDQTQFQSLLRWAVMLPVFFALLVAALFLVRVKNLRSAAHYVDQADQIIAKGFELEKFMLDSEAGVRGYIISLDTESLTPYENSLKQLPAHFELLKSWVSDEPEQSQRLNEIERTSLAWLGMSAQTMNLIQEGKDPVNFPPSPKAKKIVDLFRRQMDEFIRAEQVVRDERARAADEAARMAMINGIVLALLIGVFLTFFTRKSLRALSSTHHAALYEVEKKASALADSESRFRIMANSAPVLIWTAGLNQRCDWFSQGWLDFTGLTLEEELSRDWADRVHPDDVAKTTEIYRDFFARRQTFEMEYRLLRSDGIYRWVLDRGAPRISEAGEFSGYIGSCLDIHDRIEQQDHLKQIAEDLKDAVRSRDDFLSVASHELKTPLTVLKLQLQLNSRALKPERGLVPSPEKLERFFRTCLDQTNRLDSLVEDLFDVTRIQQGKMSFQFEEFDLSALVQEQVAQFAEPLRSFECEVSVATEGQVWVRADRFRMEQVIVNLLTNAMKYGAKHPIEVRVFAEGDRAHVKITDHGIGIEPEKQGIIFDRFERVLSKQNVGGLGLGLFIAKQIVDAHEGSLQVESKLGDGASFILSLPLAYQSSVPASAPRLSSVPHYAEDPRSQSASS